jgi:hypothetical protein
MIAERPMRYSTRRLRAGDVFEPTAAEGRLFAAIGHAKVAPAPRAEPPPQAPNPAKAAPAPAPAPAPPAPAPAAVVPAAAPDVTREDVRASAGDVADPALEALRADYEAKTGRKADKRWGADRLRAAISAAVLIGGDEPGA